MATGTQILSVPFRLAVDGQVTTVTQGGDQANAEQIGALLSTIQNERDLQPGFGMPDPAFSGLEPSTIASQVAMWGPAGVKIKAVTSTVITTEDGPNATVPGGAPPRGPLVILTDLDDEAVGADVRARIVKQRVIPLSRWQAVLAAFSASRLDPRMTERQELADALVALAPPGGYAPTPSGFLDWGSAARALVAVLFGTTVPDGTLADVVVALTDPVTVGRVASAPPAAVDEAFAWLRIRLGLRADLVRAAVVAGYTAEVPALALICGVVWSPRAIAEAPAEAAAAAVRLEPYVGAAVDPLAAQALADAGNALADSGSVPFDTLAKDAESLLAALRADQLAWASPILPSGFEMRLARLAAALAAALDTPHPTPEALTAVASCAADVAEHRLADVGPGRAAAACMAARLCRRLADPDDEATPDPATHEAGDFAAAAERYASEGSFADWAMDVLRPGEDAAEVADAYRRLIARTAEARRAANRRFGDLLARWAPVGGTSGRLVAVEDVLARVVAPLIDAGAKVLVLVVDGMSLRVYQKVLHDFLAAGWAERGRGPVGDRLVGVAAFPTVTAVSRTSLLCGALQVGDSSTEKAGFAAALGPASKVWHKPDLYPTEGMALRSDVAESLSASRGPKAVGVVVNTVDDHLLKGDQIGVRWGIAALGPLAAVLRAAVGRTVVLTADHGHVTGAKDARVAEGGGERWRPVTGAPPGDGEITLTGRRVLLGGGSVVAPWSETIRYSSGARYGYHGGAAPAEVLVPLSVLVRDDQDIDGWVDLPAQRPRWWDPQPVQALSDPAAQPVGAPTRQRRKAAPPAALPVAQLFEMPPVSSGPEVAGYDWIAALQASNTYRTQVRATARRAPGDMWVRKALTALVSRGGTLPLSALADATGSSALRARGQVSGLSAILNVDGYLVVRLDERAPGATVILDRALLAAQFDVAVP